MSGATDFPAAPGRQATEGSERSEPMSGHAISGPGFYVWDPHRDEAERWAALLAETAGDRARR